MSQPPIVGKPFPTAYDASQGPPPQAVQDLLDACAGPKNDAGLTPLGQAIANASKPPMNRLLENYGITDESSFTTFVINLTQWIPTEDFTSLDVLDVICTFYFIMDQQPLYGMQTPIEPASQGQSLSPLSDKIVALAKIVGSWMDTEGSLTKESYATFKASPYYMVSEAVLSDPNDPTGRDGFTTFNKFFGRHLLADARPVDSPQDDTVVVFPADSHFGSSGSIDMSSSITLSTDEVNADNTIVSKNLVWSIPDLLEGSSYADAFAGGVFVHSFLDTFNYHRLHTPVSGKVVEARFIPGLAFLEVQPASDGSGTLVKRRGLAPKHALDEGHEFKPVNTDPADQPNAVDGTGFQFLQCRGLYIIDNPTLGLVAVLPMGMANVSSVQPSVSQDDVVAKGDEIAFFQFGASDIVVLFQQKAGVTPPTEADIPTTDQRSVPPHEPYNLVKSRLLVAKPQLSGSGY